jgi:hypothetical protein
MIRKVEITKIKATKNDTVNKGISIVVWMILMALGMGLIIGVIGLIVSSIA